VKTSVARSYRVNQVHSKVMRRGVEREILDDLGERIAVLELQGDLQFGAAEQVLRQAAHTVAEPPGCDHLILDLHRVGRITAAARDLLGRLGRSLVAQGTYLYVARSAWPVSALGWPSGRWRCWMGVDAPPMPWRRWTVRSSAWT